MLGWRDERPLAQVLPAAVAELIEKELGARTCGDLLAHYPRDYVRKGRDVGLGAAVEGDIVTMSGTVTYSNLKVTRTGKKMLTVVVDNWVRAVFFNASWLKNLLVPGVRILLTGKLRSFQNAPELTQPDYVLLDANADTKAQSPTFRALSQFGSLQDLFFSRDWLPIYPATAKLKTWTILGAIHRVLETLPPVAEPLDYPLPLTAAVDYDTALRQVHVPPPGGPGMALARLKYNEALTLGLVMALRRADNAAHVAPALEGKSGDEGYYTQMQGALPFALTTGQTEVVETIAGDIGQRVPMQRLLQGEVGSGKTIVATLVMLRAVDSGFQAALLAPTEVLAAQHGESLRRTVPAGVKVVVLTGSMKVARKRQALLDIVSGEADIIVGTHALIQEHVDFFRLGLVVIDEQHRFGVEQREALRRKAPEGLSPHTLFMTATPIPRTIAMTVFGDLAVSSLTELPGGRKPIQTSVVPPEHPAWVERMWQRVREEVAKGRQAFVVCPRIEKEGGVEEVYAYLSNGPLADLRLMLMHGQMAEKDELMAQFSAGAADVMVSTTVIEVGVDVPNATVMIILEAEQFGISQLHQLRGRVGRGGHASLCLLHTLAQEGSVARTRLEQVAQTESGFVLAELDLQAREEGDVLGTRQSGSKRSLRLLNLVKDYEVITQAQEDAAALVERNPDLARALARDVTEDEQEFLDKS